MSAREAWVRRIGFALVGLASLGIACGTAGCSHIASSKTDLDPTEPDARTTREWASVQSLRVEGTARYWEPQQSVVAGGEPRSIGEATFTLVQNLRDGWSQIDWKRKTDYPFRRIYEFHEVITERGGVLVGSDSWYAAKDAAPHPMSADHLATAKRELASLSPGSIGLKAFSGIFELTSDPKTSLPTRLRSRDFDTIEGDSNYDVTLSDWHFVEGLAVAHTLRHKLNGRILREMTLETVDINAPIAGNAASVMEPLPSDPSPGGVLPYQWVSRRLAMGGYAQDESVSKMHFVEMEPGVHLVSGRPHNALVVELAKSLVVIDAPIDEAYSRWTIDACKVKFPGKRIEALVITHHHNDHSGGARAYVAEGAIVVVGAPNRAHFERMFKAPHVIDGDSLQRRPRAATIVEVTDEYQIKDAKRPLRLVRIKNDHAQGMLFAYMPSSQLGFVADLWSPGRDKMGSAQTFDRHHNLVAALRAINLTPKRIAGGHGAIGNYADLVEEVDHGVQSE